jgi:hypothetical protein
MIRIISIDDKNADGVSWWRNLRPLTELQRTHDDVQIEFLSDDVKLQKLMSADLIIMFRPIRPKTLQFLENCKKELFNTKIILDIDDNLWRIPPGHPCETEYAEYGDTLRRIYALADGIWCSTDAIMPFADALDGRGMVIPNAVLPSDLPDKPAPWLGRVCWRGSIAQFMDIYSEDAQKQFIDNQDKFNHWLMYGYYPANIRGHNVRGKSSVPVFEYMESLKHLGINIMWKPLEDNQFNAAKSNIAWIEATISGGVCVTNFAGRPGWEMAIDKFTDNQDFVASQWAASKEWILKHYNLCTVNELRYLHILSVLGMKLPTRYTRIPVPEQMMPA